MPYVDGNMICYRQPTPVEVCRLRTTRISRSSDVKVVEATDCGFIVKFAAAVLYNVKLDFSDLSVLPEIYMQ